MHLRFCFSDGHEATVKSNNNHRDGSRGSSRGGSSGNRGGDRRAPGNGSSSGSASNGRRTRGGMTTQRKPDGRAGREEKVFRMDAIQLKDPTAVKVLFENISQVKRRLVCRLAPR